jgi:hypothetical protein
MQFDVRCCHIPEDFWERHRTSIAEGSFWSDEIHKVRDQTHERLRIAVENLPLPAAFREAAIALRQIIRDRRKAKEPNEQESLFLYSLAAVESFTSATKYLEDLGEPSWNALEMMSADDWQSLTFEWSSLGCNELPLLTKTDRRQMIDRWGEPPVHTNLRRLHENVWQRALDALLVRRVNEHNQGLVPRRPLSAQEYLDFCKKVRERVMQMRSPGNSRE